MVGVTDRRVFEQVLDEENVARYSLDGFYKQIIESEASLTVLGSLLRGGGGRAISRQSRERQ